MTRKDAKNAGELGQWNNWRNEQLASQTHRAQQQSYDWRERARGNALMGIEGARTYGNQGYDQGLDQFNKYGQRLEGIYGDLKARLPGFYDQARGYYDQDVKMGNLGDQFITDNFGNPRGFENYLVGELDTNAIMQRADEARTDSLRSSNARSGLSTMAYAGAEEARHNTALQDQLIARGHYDTDMGYAQNLGMRGAQGRMNQANLTQGEWDATKNLGMAEAGDFGQLAQNRANMLLNRGMFNANLEGNKGQLNAQTALAHGGEGRADFDYWRDQSVANDQWVKNALYSDMVRQQMMAFQSQQADKASQNALLGSVLGLGGKVFGGMF